MVLDILTTEASARETAVRVAAGSIAEKVLNIWHGIEIVAVVSSIGHEFLFSSTSSPSPSFQDFIGNITRQRVDEFLPTRCPDKQANARMLALIEQVSHTEAGNSRMLTFEQVRDAQDSIEA